MDLAARHHASERAFYTALAERVVELGGGVVASITPAAPERSLFNAVLYEDGAALRGAIPELARLYDEAGVLAWTVWVHPGDAETAAALEAAGHVLDGRPELMGAPLDEISRRQRIAVDLERAPTWAQVAEVNERAYGLPAGAFAAALDADDERLRRYVAVEAGRPVATAVIALIDGDAYVTFVATVPEAQGRGLGTEVMRLGLEQAAADGATTTTLEASARGRPVYERLGYRALGAYELRERRRAA